MKKLLRLIFRILIFATLILLLIMLYKAFTINSKQITVEQTKEYIASDNVLQNLSAGIQLPTVSVGSIDSSVFYRLDTLLQELFPVTDSLLERERVNDFSYIYKWQGKNPRLAPVLLLGHTDVVGVEGSTEEKWTQAPFSGKIQDGYVWGRGALDDKLNVFSILEATESLLLEGFIPERTIFFAFGHDEEVGGNRGAVTMAKIFKDRGIEFEYILDEGLVILENALDGLERPLAMIGTTEKGYTTLTLTAILKEGGHSSMPPPETAVGVLSKAIVALQENPFPPKLNGATKQFFEYIAPECNFLQKTLFSNLSITQGLIASQLTKDNTSAALLRTTTAPTMLRGGVQENILPTRASAKVNFRILPGETVETVMQYVKDIMNDERIIVSHNKDFSEDPSPISPTESFGFEILQKTISKVFPEAVVAPNLVIATTDARHYTDVSNNVYRFSPIVLTKPDLKTIHGIDEKISIEGYRKMIYFYRELLVDSTK